MGNYITSFFASISDNFAEENQTITPQQPSSSQAAVTVEIGANQSTQVLVETSKSTTDHVVISEIQVSMNEFVELYNPTDSDVDMSSWYFAYYSLNNDWNEPSLSIQFPNGAKIKSHGFYLLGSIGYILTSDKTFSSEAKLSPMGGAVGIFPFDPKTKSIEEAEAGKIDVVGWGSFDSNVLVSPKVFEGSPVPVPMQDKSLERKPGYLEPSAGNYVETNDNSKDFLERDVPEPQTSSSPIE